MSRTPSSKYSRLALTLPTITLLPSTKSRLILSAGISILLSPPVTLVSTSTPFLPILDFICLVNSLLADRRRFEQNSHLFLSLRKLDDELCVINVIFGQVPMAQIDPALVIRVVCRHIVGADEVVDALSRTANGRDHIISRLKFCDVRRDGFDPSKTFVANNQVVESRGRCAVFGGIDFLVGAIDADSQDLHEHASAVRDLVERRFRRICKMDAARFARKYADCFHKNDSSLTLRFLRDLYDIC